ncbi:unnamed protein product [Tuber aestivum]|uniref:Uncharacterized protein n=1 Tax=Tuber aestivum TaxID=59557 RepID=A0A292Q5R6_9PEZI|nr:unnamed protein product [Tuber aestivum]
MYRQQQQQPRTETRLQTPLQILPAMLHAVFIQTADVFNTPARQQPGAVMYTNAQVRASIPICNERFQYALDQLEMEILTAKAALRRDLTALRTAAQAREEARLAAERARLEEQRRREAEIAARKEAEERARREKERKEEEERKRRQEAEERERERARRAEEEALAAKRIAASQNAGTVALGGAAGYNPHYGQVDDDKEKENPAPLPPGSANASSPSPGGAAAAGATASGGSGGDSFHDFMASVAAGGYIDGGQPMHFMDDFLGEFGDSMFTGT